MQLPSYGSAVALSLVLTPAGSSGGAASRCDGGDGRASANGVAFMLGHCVSEAGAGRTDAILLIDLLVLSVCCVSQASAGRINAVLSINPLVLSESSSDDNDSRQHLLRVAYIVIGISISSVASG